LAHRRTSAPAASARCSPRINSPSNLLAHWERVSPTARLASSQAMSSGVSLMLRGFKAG